MASEQDSVWKEILDAYFQEFIAFFFPNIHKDIDWAKSYEFLDKELEKIEPDNAVGRKVVDKLIKVFLLSGREKWVLIHIEVQGYPDADFEERMFTYYYLILNRYKAKVVSLAILTDVNKKYRPKAYESEEWECELRFKFPTIKLIDYNSRWAELEADSNPFALVVMAHLKAQKLKKPSERMSWKLILIKMLYERGYERQEIIKLFRFIDWLISLPVELEPEFRQELDKLQEEKAMPYVTSIERLAKEEGRQEGQIQGQLQGRQEGQLQGRQEGQLQERQSLVSRLLKRRIGTLSPELEQQIGQLSFEQLGELGEALLDFKDEAALKNWLVAR